MVSVGATILRAERVSLREDEGQKRGELCCTITANGRSARLDGHRRLWNQPAGIRFALTRTISRHASLWE